VIVNPPCPLYQGVAKLSKIVLPNLPPDKGDGGSQLAVQTTKMNKQIKTSLRHNRDGTILIWTVLLGVMLTSVFFFMATRLSGMGAEQRQTIQYQNQKAYLDSYVAYLMAHPSEIDGKVDGINIKLTQNVTEITGILDSGKTSDPYPFAGTITVDWNLCGEDYDADITINGITYPGTVGSCGDGEEYDDSQTGINVPPDFTITAPNAPFYYRITSSNPMKDNKWHLTAGIDLGYGKKIEVEKVFNPPS
jgi:hypothetical protein